MANVVSVGWKQQVVAVVGGVADGCCRLAGGVVGGVVVGCWLQGLVAGC